jgi:hypothetical protein
MRVDCLSVLPLRKGATIVIGGPYYHTLSKRLAHFIRRERPRLKVQIRSTVAAVGEHDVNALSLITPSFNPNQNRSICRNFDGIVNAIEPDRFEYTDAISGKQTTIDLPRMPAHVTELLSELGYQQ